jgi:hypothetical protein
LEAPAKPELTQALSHRGVRLGHPSRLPQIYKIDQSEEAHKKPINRGLDPPRPYDTGRGFGLDCVKL